MDAEGVRCEGTQQQGFPMMSKALSPSARLYPGKFSNPA